MADTAPQVRRVVARLVGRGFTVVQIPGWESRGRGSMTTRARIEHHTAGPRTGDSPSLHVVTFGREGLRNSLSRWFVSRSGKIYLVALGLSWHAGTGSLVTNGTSSGTEAEHSGSRSEPWPPASLAAQRAISEEECAEFGVSHSRVFDHREHAPTRKIDRINISSTAWRASLGTPPDRRAHSMFAGIKVGDQGDHSTREAELQRFLNDIPGVGPLTVDGAIGAKTRAEWVKVTGRQRDSLTSFDSILIWRAWAQAQAVYALRGHDHDARYGLRDYGPPTATHEPAWQWAEAEGLLNGRDPGGPIDRKGLALVLHRFRERFGGQGGVTADRAREVSREEIRKARVEPEQRGGS